MTKRIIEGLEYPRVDNYLNAFHLAQVQKYLKHKGPLYLEVVDDQMYPFLKFGDYLKLSSKSEGRGARLVSFWSEGKICTGFVKDESENELEVGFSNSGFASLSVLRKHVIGPVGITRLPLLRRLKFLFFLLQFKALRPTK